MSQDKSTQPRASSAFWSKPVSNGKGMLYDSMILWWLGRFQNKGREIFDNQLWFLFGDTKGAVE